MATGTVKSFNHSKGYGFIRMDSGGADVLVHLSAVREAGLAKLRKGQKVDFEIFDHQGKVAAKDLRIDAATESNSEPHSISPEMIPETERGNTSEEVTEQPDKKRTWITRAALEQTLAETVRGSDPECEGLIGIIVERIVPAPSDGANWIVKGVKYGKAQRERCRAAISKCVEDSQREFEVLD
jgi:cold shock CspA family protein